MWFESRRREPVSEETPQHWSTERMILEGYAEIATPEDLEQRTDESLANIAKICEVEEAAPDECIPCAAYALYMDRQRERLAALAPNADLAAHVEKQVSEAIKEPIEEELFLGKPPFREEPAIQNISQVPVVERFANQVGVLQSLVTELLEGDPIPPPEVSLEELALLTVAAQKWIRIIEAQGTETLSPQQQAVLDSTKALVSRLRHDTSNH
jgi:hypothetical protein